MYTKPLAPNILYSITLILCSIVSWNPVFAVEQPDEIYRRRAPYLWAFYQRHPENYALTTAAHWAHGAISDILLEASKNPTNSHTLDIAFKEQALSLLKRPAYVEPTQADVGPAFARLSPLAPKIIDWAHELHEALYDIMADDSLSDSERRHYIKIETDYYLDEPSLAFSPAPLAVIVRERVQLMKQPWFKAFRKAWPQTTQLFWAFHWWHPAVYETQLHYGPKQSEAVRQIDTLFWNQVLSQPPNRMLLSNEVMPRFSRMAPEAANIFDNLHQFHGIVYDILASPLVDDKKSEIYRMIRLMLVRPGDRKLATSQSTAHSHPIDDPLNYLERYRRGMGEMGRIMGMDAAPHKREEQHQ